MVGLCWKRCLQQASPPSFFPFPPSSLHYLNPSTYVFPFDAIISHITYRRITPLLLSLLVPCCYDIAMRSYRVSHIATHVFKPPPSIASPMQYDCYRISPLPPTNLRRPLIWSDSHHSSIHFSSRWLLPRDLHCWSLWSNDSYLPIRAISR